jgi:hypothetical protein
MEMDFVWQSDRFSDAPLGDFISPEDATRTSGKLWDAVPSERG